MSRLVTTACSVFTIYVAASGMVVEPIVTVPTDQAHSLCLF